jgi:rRNA maturation endonuclease Nob1
LEIKPAAVRIRITFFERTITFLVHSFFPPFTLSSLPWSLDQELLHEVIGNLSAISFKESLVIQDEQTSSVETLHGSCNDLDQETGTNDAATSAREVLEVCSNESIDGSSHQDSEAEDLNLKEQIHEIQAQLEDEAEAPQKVHFSDEEAPAGSSSAEEAPTFDEENFPSLGSAAPLPSAPAAAAPVANSWAKRIAAPSSDSPVVFSNIKLPSKNYVLSAASSLPSSSLPPSASNSLQTESPSSSDPSSSRIISSGGGVGDYVSKAASTFMEAEDDGVGWINPKNLSGCRTTGEGMLHSQSKTLVKKSTEDPAASASAVGHVASPAETKLTKSQKRNKKKREKLAASADAAATVTAAGEVPRTEEEEAPLGFRNLHRSPPPHRVPPPAAAPVEERLVGCMTTDYAMQNVMLQMGLQVISLDGNVIRTVKQWILRCAGCYQIHYDMSRLFCARCGLNMLQKISASIDSKTGELRLHLKKNYLPNRRGQVYSLPAPGKQDRFEGELLLREDQLLSGIWKQKVVKIQKDIRSAFGDDITSDVGLQINKGSNIKVGLGKRNPNAEKGRERRGKRKQKK